MARSRLVTIDHETVQDPWNLATTIADLLVSYDLEAIGAHAPTESDIVLEIVQRLQSRRMASLLAEH